MKSFYAFRLKELTSRSTYYGYIGLKYSQELSVFDHPIHFLLQP